jgi:hypothetical protein
MTDEAVVVSPKARLELCHDWGRAGKEVFDIILSTLQTCAQGRTTRQPPFLKEAQTQRTMGNPPPTSVIH